MEITTGKPWLDRLNRVNSEVLLPLMGLSILLFSTVLVKLTGGVIETCQNVLALMILGIVGVNILSGGKSGIAVYIKENLFIVLYIAVRIISFIAGGLSYVTLRSIFFEAFFLIGISKYTACSEKQFGRYINMFLTVELVFSTISLILYIVYCSFSSDALTRFLWSYTNYSISLEAAAFSNANTAGIMGAFAVIVLLSKAVKEGGRKKKIIYCLLAVYQLLFVYLQNCRSAELGLVFIGIIVLIKHFTKKITKKQLMILSGAAFLVCMGIMYCYIGINVNSNPKSLNTAETAIDNVSSGRYSLWKGCFIEQKDHVLLGAGALSTEKDNRQDIFSNPENGYSDDMKPDPEFGTHNGYIGMISVTGWLGFIIFAVIMFSKIKKSRFAEQGPWYLVIILLLEINMFETLFILNRFFLCFYSLLILETRPEE